MIAIVSVANDVHYRCVAEELRRMGRDSFLVEIPKLGNEARFTLAAGGERYQNWSVPGHGPIDLEQVDCVWYRRVFPPVLQPAPVSRADAEWALREWREATTAAFEACGARFVSPAWAQERAGMKPYQLRVAHRLGLRVPDTLMTNDAEAARAFVHKHEGRVVHKVVKTPRDRFVGTRKWHPSDEAELQWLYLTPTFFQEQIVAPYELRITIVGRRIFAAEFAVGSGVIDARSLLDTPFKEHRLPRETEALLLKLMDELGLQYGTIDMKLCENGEYVFLEINPQGQFLYVEIKTGMPITLAMAELLAHGQN
jgi:glutathione synthase/RimK-type ligase-like ATP-grasp enzyme